MLFNLVKFSSIQTNIETVNGVQYLEVFGPETYLIRNQLSSIGFRWNNANKVWYINFNQLTSNQNNLMTLQSLGVNLPLTPSPAVFPTNRQQNWLQRSSRTWWLATVKTFLGKTGNPIALSQEPDKTWAYVMYDEGQWKNGNIDKDIDIEYQIQDLVESVKDTNGNKVSGNDPQKLILQYFPDIIKKNNPTELSQKKPEEPKGRISPDKISHHQKIVETSFLNSKNNIMMNALAGSGKTTMLRHLASFKPPGEKWLYLVFNKKNQIEGAGKFPRDIEVLTSHAFLGRVLNENSRIGNVDRTDIWEKGERISQIVDLKIDKDQDIPYPLRFGAKTVIKNLASLSKSYAINPDDPNAPTYLKNIIDQYQIDCDLSTTRQNSNVDYSNIIIEKTIDIMKSCLPGSIDSPALMNFRDHDDTLWYSAIMSNKMKWPRYNVVLADEVQDFNKCQLIMLQKLSQAGARIVCVGDPNQAIYLFRGADANAFTNIGTMMNGLPTGSTNNELPVNYRSGKSIIDFVNKNTKVQNLQAGMKHDGVVTTDIEFDNALDSLQQEWATNHKLKEPTAFISRTNKPLIDAALSLMKNNMDFVLIGRDFSKELISHVKKVTGEISNKNIPISNFVDSLQQFAAKAENNWKGKISKAPELKQIKETTESLMSILDYLSMHRFNDPRVKMQIKDSNSFMEYLKLRFGGINTDTVEGSQQLSSRDPLSYVTICTAHRSKGLEFDRVFIIQNDLFPHPNAKTPEAMDQEENARYVAYTRAMNELHILVHPKPTAAAPNLS